MKPVLCLAGPAFLQKLSDGVRSLACGAAAKRARGEDFRETLLNAGFRRSLPGTGLLQQFVGELCLALRTQSKVYPYSILERVAVQQDACCAWAENQIAYGILCAAGTGRLSVLWYGPQGGRPCSVQEMSEFALMLAQNLILQALKPLTTE